MSSIVEPLPWRHRPFAALARTAWPIGVSMLSYGVMTLVDTLFVGRLGAAALAGVGLGGVAFFFVICFALGALRGVKVLSSQALGAGRAELGQTWLAAGLALAGALAGASVGAGLIVASQLHHLADSPASAEAARLYVVLRVVGAPVMLGHALLREHRYGMGDTRSPMVSSLLGNVANVGLSPLLIFGADLGVAGAAVSTVLAQLLELATLLWLGRRALGLRRPSLAQLRELWRVGWPTGLQFQLELGSFAMLTAIIASMGDVQLAAHQVTLQVLHLAFLPTAAIGDAGGILAGQAVGAGRLRLVRRVARYALWMALTYMALCTGALVLGGAHIARAFSPDPELQAVTVSLLLVAAVFQLADGAAITARGVLRGVGDVKFPAAVGIAAAWVCTPPLAYGLGHLAGLGALGGWIGLSVEISAAALVFWWRLERLGWLRPARRARAQLALA